MNNVKERLFIKAGVFYKTVYFTFFVKVGQIIQYFVPCYVSKGLFILKMKKKAIRRFNMKKIITIMAVIAILLSASGCSNANSPKAVVERKIAEIKRDPLKALGSLEPDEEKFSSIDSKEAKALMAQLGKMINKIKYTVSNEQINGDSATVDVHFTSYDFGTSFGETLMSYFGQALMMAFSGASEEDMEKKLYEIWLSDLKKLEQQGLSKESDYTVRLNKKDGQWETDVINEDFVNAFMGDILSAFNKLSQSVDGNIEINFPDD